MNLLLDTNIVIWWLAGSSRISRKLRDTVINGEVVYVSAVSPWEIAIKASAGKLEFDGDLVLQLKQNSFTSLPITIAHATAVGKLPRLHGDPFDRMLIAQAHVESLTLVTADKQLSDYGVPIVLV